ncbi:hypothetical protein KYJ26_18805 [Bacillus sp. MCCB 382]|uniref:hypothetical protein n=1 Tax=Bacillus sp. MCCB 382 TaxID=2860197 RepID=UPI001C559B70|nr:hypothetical protein [Bacillus sp. MCCB 382]
MAFFAILVDLTYDLEGLAAGAGHRRKAEGARPEVTSISGKSLKALFAFGDFSEMTSSLKLLELDISKSGGARIFKRGTTSRLGDHVNHQS